MNNNYIINNGEYPPDILYLCINCYYDILKEKNKDVVNNIKNENIIQKTLYELSIQQKLNIEISNLKINEDNIEIQQNILKKLYTIYDNINNNLQKGFQILDKENLSLFENYLLEYRRDIEGNMISGSCYEVLRNSNFHFTTRINDEYKEEYDNLRFHPFSNDSYIKYFVTHITIKDAMKITQKLLFKIKDENILKHILYSFTQLYLLYQDLYSFSLLKENTEVHDLLDKRYIDFIDRENIFDIPKKYVDISINEKNINLLYDLLEDYPFYHFYIEFKFLIFNLCKNISCESDITKDKDYEINLNDWENYNIEDNNYLLHKDSNKIYFNKYPNIGLRYFSLNDLYLDINIMNIFTNIIYGYDFKLLVELDKFQLYMWDNKNYEDDRVLVNNSLEMNMTQGELDFIYKCLDFLKTNPRKIKRILNIISLTRYIIDNKKNLFEEIQINKDLLYQLIIKFIILYEQWPFRTTWLSIWINECYEINDCDIQKENKWLPEKIMKNIGKYNDINDFLVNTSLTQMYYYIEEYIFSSDKLLNLSKMDCDPDAFFHFLDIEISETINNKYSEWNCLNMIDSEKLNFNHNPAIYATCMNEINKLQINMKYDKDNNLLSNLILKEINKQGLPIKINDTQEEKDTVSDNIFNQVLDENENNIKICIE